MREDSLKPVIITIAIVVAGAYAWAQLKEPEAPPQISQTIYGDYCHSCRVMRVRDTNSTDARIEELETQVRMLKLLEPASVDRKE